MSTFTPPAIYWADPTTDPQPSGNRSFRWQYTNGTKHIYRGYNGSTIDAGPMEIYYDTSDQKWHDSGTDHPNAFIVNTTQSVPSNWSGATDPSSATGTSNAEYVHLRRNTGSHLFSFQMAGWSGQSSPWTVTTTSTPATGTQSHSYVQDSIRDITCTKTAAYTHKWVFKHRDVSSAPYHSGMGTNAVTYTCKHWPGGGNTSTDIVQEAFSQADGTYDIEIVSNTTFPNAQIVTGDVSTLHANIDMQVLVNGNWSWVTAGDIIASFTYESTNVTYTVGAGYVGDTVSVVAVDTNQYPDYDNDIYVAYTLDNPPANHQGSSTQLSNNVFTSNMPSGHPWELNAANNYTMSGTWIVGDDGSSTPTGLPGTFKCYRKTPVPQQLDILVLSRAFALSPYGQSGSTRRRAHSFW